MYDHCGTYVKEPTHYLKRAGREVPGVVAGLCESFGMGGYGMGGYRKRGTPCMGLSVPFVYHLALRCKSCETKSNYLIIPVQLALNTSVHCQFQH